jgi:hypothetical protein
MRYVVTVNRTELVKAAGRDLQSAGLGAPQLPGRCVVEAPFSATRAVWLICLPLPRRLSHLTSEFTQCRAAAVESSVVGVCREYLGPWAISTAGTNRLVVACPVVVPLDHLSGVATSAAIWLTAPVDQNPNTKSLENSPSSEVAEIACAASLVSLSCYLHAILHSSYWSLTLLPRVHQSSLFLRRRLCVLELRPRHHLRHGG